MPYRVIGEPFRRLGNPLGKGLSGGNVDPYAWMLTTGITASNIIAGYQFAGQTSLANAYLRRKGSGGNANLDPAVVGTGVAPTTFDPLHGIMFDGVNDFLATGVTPTAAFTRIIAVLELGSNVGAFAADGVYDGSTEIVLYPNYGTAEGGAAGTTGGKFGGTTLDTQAPNKWRGAVFAYSTNGNKMYVDGVDFKTMTGGTLPSAQMYIGNQNFNGVPSRYGKFYCQAWVAYNTGLTGTQIAAITTALQTQLALSSLLRGAYTFYGSPHAVHYASGADKTYLSMVGPTGVPKIAEYNHATDTMSAPVMLKRGLPDYEIDDHGNPNILVRLSDSKLVTWYCKHNDASHIYQRVSTNAEDASSWAAEANIATGWGLNPYTYPTPVQLDAEVGDPIYLFFRAYTGGNASLYYSVSTDDAATWAAPVQLFVNAGEIPYWEIVQNGTDRIDFTITDGHPNHVETNSVYHFYYTGGNIYQSDGTLVGAIGAGPYGPGNVTKVYDGSTTSAWVWDIAIDGSGNPVIAYVTFPGDTFPTVVPDHRYNQARWNGSAWSSAQVCAGGGSVYSGQPYYSGGIGINHDDVDTVYVSEDATTGQFEIYKYTSADSGATWTKASTITSGSSLPNIRPVVPLNSSTEIAVIWMYGRYTSFTDYYTYIKSNPQYS